MLQDGKSHLCNVDKLELEGQGPQDTQLIQQLWHRYELLLLLTVPLLL
jgi:hypothetical protein